jgi:RNA polymerase sigma factor (TIGR02999 family)
VRLLTSVGRDSSGPAAEAVTRLLEAWRSGDLRARDELLPMVYAELRRRAAAHLRHERPHHTLRPTDLLHEAYLRLCAQNAGFENRDHFFAVASRLMRRVLVDHARARAAAKRGRALRVTLADDVAAPSQPADLLELDAALDELFALDEREAQVVELRFFGGLSLQETARVLGISLATTKNDWAHARAWLYARLDPGSLRS